MLLYRITDARYADDLSGEGARRAGGRWNPKGLPLLYTANSSALAALEVLAGIDWDLAPPFALVVLEIPHPPERRLAQDDLPQDWHRTSHPQLARIGEDWIKKAEELAMRVPSATIPTAPDGFNVLINPLHQDLQSVKIIDVLPFAFDPRLT